MLGGQTFPSSASSTSEPVSKSLLNSAIHVTDDSDEFIDLNDTNLLKSPREHREQFSNTGNTAAKLAAAASAPVIDFSIEASLESLKLDEESLPGTPKASKLMSPFAALMTPDSTLKLASSLPSGPICKGRESLAFFNSISNATDIETLDDMQFEEVELPDIQIADAPSVAAVNPEPAVVDPSEAVQEPVADPIRIETLDTDFSDRPKATFNPFDQKDSLQAFQTPVKLRDDGDDDLVFMGTPTEKELELAAKLSEMPTIKAKGEREKEARANNVDSLKSPTIARIVKKSLLASPKRTVDRSTMVLDKLKTPPPVANVSQGSKKAMETPQLIRDLRKKIDNISKMPCSNPCTEDSISSSCTPRKAAVVLSKEKGASVTQSPGVQSWLNKRKKNLSVDNSPALHKFPKVQHQNSSIRSYSSEKTATTAVPSKSLSSSSTTTPKRTSSSVNNKLKSPKSRIGIVSKGEQTKFVQSISAIKSVSGGCGSKPSMLPKPPSSAA